MLPPTPQNNNNKKNNNTTTVRGRIRKYKTLSTRSKGIFRKVLEFAEKNEWIIYIFLYSRECKKVLV